jgi:hypothetical protein
MSKKIIMACMAVAAFAAFVMPATASATNTPHLTEGVTPVAVGAKILGTNVGETRLKDTSGNTILSCSTATMTGEVTKNSGGTVEGKISSATFAGTGLKQAAEPDTECTGSLGNSGVTPLSLPWSLKSTPLMATDEFQITPSAGGKIKFKLAVTVPFSGTITCGYEAVGPIKGTGTTGTDLVHIPATAAASGFNRIEGAFPCPTSGTLEMTFTLETDAAGNTPITINHA